jgi:hypothetical protein
MKLIAQSVLFCRCIIQCFFAHELWPCASKWIELCKPSSVHYLLRKRAWLFSISKMLNTPYQSSVPTLGFTCIFAHLLRPCTLPLWFWQKGDYLWGDSQPMLKTKDNALTSLTRARVNQHQPVHHPLMTRLWMILNWVTTRFHLGNPFYKK